MESRLRENPTHIIECWCEVVAPQGRDHPPWIIQKFPRTYEDEALKNVPQFTFPCSFKKSTVEHFSFVLTDLDSKFLYGFCRHAPDSGSAFVVLSRLPWHKLFYKLLNHCASLVNNNNPGELWTFLQSLYQLPVPHPGAKLTVNYGEDKYFVDDCPNHLTLPTIPENRNLNEYFNAVDAENMMIIFASMLNERRIIITSERLSRLSACVQAANYLIYPMTWQHIFIPVLPEDLLDYLNAPMPFLIGVSSSLMQKVRIDEIGDVVILNADNNDIQTPFNDYNELPDEVISMLRKNLKPPNVLLGDNVARTFLKTIVQLVGNYREALTFRDEDKRIGFDEEKFISNRPHHFQPFVEKMLQLQLFKQFIEERLQLLNSGLHTSDEFELEASVFSEKSSSKVKLIYSNVKKESGAIMLDLKRKVKKHGKAVEKKSKNAYKDIRVKFKEMQQPTNRHSSADSKYLNGNSSRPQSAPSSPSSSFRKPSASSINYKGHTAKVSYVRPNNIPSDKSTETFHSSTSDATNKTPSPQDMDLMGELTAAFDSQFSDRDFPPKCKSTSSLGYHPMTNSSSSTSMGSNPSSSSLAYEFLQSSPTQCGNPHSWSDPRSHAELTDNQNVEAELMKPLSASLTSLPTLDLALDIELPPPLFPVSSNSHSSLPVCPNDRRSMPVAPPPDSSASYRSPRPNYDVALQTGLLHRAQSDPSRTFPLAPCASSKGMPQGPTVKPANFAWDPASGLGNQKVVSTNQKSNMTTMHALSGHSKLVSGCAHSNNASPRFPRFPKYDVSPRFSASLARFYAQNSNANYFYSSLLKLSHAPKENKTHHPCESMVSPEVPPLSPCGVGFAGDVLFTKAPVNDVMSASLPAGLTSLSSLSSNTPLNNSTHDLPLLDPPPRSRRRKANTSYIAEGTNNENLIFLEAPIEEPFDPLDSKDITPPVPARSISATKPTLGASYSLAHIPEQSPSPADRADRIAPLSPSRFLPFSNAKPSVASNFTAQNPTLHTQHPQNNTSLKPTTSLPSNSIYGSKPPARPSKNNLNINQHHVRNLEKDLLGDFTAGFESLSVAKKT